MNKQALIIIDMLNDFVLEGSPLEVPAAKSIVDPIRARLLKARGTSEPVFFICDSHDEHDSEFARMGWPPHAVAGTSGSSVVDALAPAYGEGVIRKKTYSGFYNTELDGRLRADGITDLVITGCVTNICVLYTAADAVMRGYRVTVPADCVAGISPDAHAFALGEMENVLGVSVERSGS